MEENLINLAGEIQLLELTLDTLAAGVGGTTETH
jgi:hypothetical protein